MGHIFLLCMAGDLWLDARYSECHLVGFSIFLYSNNSSWVSPWDVVKFCKEFDLFDSCSYDLLGESGVKIGQKLIIPHYWGKPSWVLCPIPHELWVFPALLVSIGIIPRQLPLIFLNGSLDRFLTCMYCSHCAEYWRGLCRSLDAALSSALFWKL